MFMKTNSKWMPTTISIVVLSLTTALVAPGAFAEDPKVTSESKEPAIERVAETTVSAPLPNRPVFKVAQAVTPPQQPATTARTAFPTKAAPPQTQSKSKKWIWIVAAAGAAGATAYFVGRGDGIIDPPPPTTSIVVGTPIVGGPQ
jgi:hypothetical protein